MGRVPRPVASALGPAVKRSSSPTGETVDVAQIRGLGGAGKSLLAEEYALRFSAAYPGGVFWLSAFGGDETP